MNNQTDSINEVNVVDEDQDSENIQEMTVISEAMEPEPQEEPRESAGVILKRAREAQGVSLEIVHEATKIPMDALRAIEEGYTIRMLSLFYYKGFLKMYAGYLGVDVKEVIEDYKQEELPKHIDKIVEEFEAPKWINQIFTRRRKQKIVIALGIVLGLFCLFKVIGFFTQRPSSPGVKGGAGETKIVKKKAPQPQVPPKIKQVPSTVSPNPVKPASIVPAATVGKDITLTVRAKQNSWLRVKADTQVVFQSTLRLGAVETWVADDEIEISGKNINALEFELNGKMIGTLGRKDRNAKKVVITKSGLSVKD